LLIQRVAMSQSFNDVTTDNFAQLSSKIVAILAESTFIAIDTEFTGLGEKHDNVRAPYVHLLTFVRPTN
jgi:hypothetical protein